MLPPSSGQKSSHSITALRCVTTQKTSTWFNYQVCVLFYANFVIEMLGITVLINPLYVKMCYSFRAFSSGRGRRQHAPLKLCPTTSPHGVITHKNRTNFHHRENLKVSHLYSFSSTLLCSRSVWSNNWYKLLECQWLVWEKEHLQRLTMRRKEIWVLDSAFCVCVVQRLIRSGTVNNIPLDLSSGDSVSRG
jgi:hypothetical protein